MSGEANKKLKKLICAGIVTLALTGCQKEARATLAETYFPLNLGNSWTYTNGTEELTFTIIGTEEIDGHTYYKFDEYFSLAPPTPNGDWPIVLRNVLFRRDSITNRILRRRSGGDEIIRYDFTGEEWYAGDMPGRCNQIGTNLVCNVPAGEFSDCIEFGLGESHSEPGTYIFGEYLAPSVGLIKFVSPGGGLSEGQEFTFVLQSYTIVPRCGDPNHPYPVGDLNHDCRVDLLDLAILASHWLERVNLEPVVYITNPPDGFEFYWAAESVWIAANAWDVDGSVVKVEFFVNGNKWGEDDDGTNGWRMVASFDVGTYILTAKATDDDGATATSPPVTITAAEELPPAAYIIEPDDGSVIPIAQETIVIRACAYANCDASLLKVEFFANGSNIGEDNDGSHTNIWEMAWSEHEVGTYILTAKATDDNGATTTSSLVTITVVE